MTPDPAGLIGKKMSASDLLDALLKAHANLKNIPDFAPETTEPPLRALAEELELKPGQLFGIIRMAVTGQAVSPPLFESMEIIGKEKSLTRMVQAIELLKQTSRQVGIIELLEQDKNSGFLDC